MYKLHYLTTICALLISWGSFSQIAHDLEIYSEDGLKFTLILNGRKMNEKPVSNIQILNTDKDYLSAKIKFEDSAIPDIQKNVLGIANPSTDESVKNKPVSVVYKIVEKKGKYKLKFASRSDKKIQTETNVTINNTQVVQESEDSGSSFKMVIRW